MSTDLLALPARDGAGVVRVVIESPRGSQVKLKHSPRLQAFVLSRPLPSGVTYPFDWGFVPGTQAADGDPLDAMVMLDAATFPAVVVCCRPLAVLEGKDLRVFGRGRSGWRAAAAKPTVARLHEWRKRAKDLRYTLDLLEPVWPRTMKALADEADTLADRLGEDHDLALLRRFACEVSGDGGDERELLALIDAARRRLQADAWALAARIYDARPPRFARRLGTYWRAWRAEATPDDEDAVAAAPSDDRRLAG